MTTEFGTDPALLPPNVKQAELVLVTPTGNPNALEANKQYLAGGTGLGDPGIPILVLPDSTTSEVGDEIAIFVADGPFSNEAVEIQTQGSDFLIGMGAQPGVDTRWRFQGTREIEARLIGLIPGFGIRVWLLNPKGTRNETMAPDLIVCSATSTVALPAYTPSGTDQDFDDTLTADAVGGPLTVDGYVTAAGARLLLRHEPGGTKNGVWDVVDPGDGSNPFVLRRSTAFAKSTAAADAIAIVRNGTTYSRTLWAVGQGVGLNPQPVNVDLGLRVYDGAIRSASKTTRKPLPSYTPSGSGLEQRLTATANGALIVNGDPVGLGQKVCVACEVGTNRRWNGLWEVEATGDGSNPWILKVDPAWSDQFFGALGSFIVGLDGFGAPTFYSFGGKTQVGLGAAGGDLDKTMIRPANLLYVLRATTEPLPAFTPSGTANTTDEILTANANGAIVVDGVTPSVGERILVAEEAGTDRAYNGVYVVEAVGDVSNPFILRRAFDLSSPEDARPGAVILVQNEDITSATRGRVYVWHRLGIGAQVDVARTEGMHDGITLGDVTGAITIDVSRAKRFSLRLTGNVTITFANARNIRGRAVELEIRQDGVGGWTTTYANASGPGGSTPVATATANRWDLVGVRSRQDSENSYFAFDVAKDFA